MSDTRFVMIGIVVITIGFIILGVLGSQFTEIIKSELSKNNIFLNNQKLKNNNHEKITIGEAAEIIYSLYKDNINLVSRL